MRVSVLLPVFNAEKTLATALDSILGQTFGDFEIVAIDDGSRDGSAEILRRYAKADGRMRPQFNPENGGLIRRLNEGLALARGELVARMDADDEALPGRFKAQVEFLAAHPDVAVLGSWAFYMAQTRAADRLVRLPYAPASIAAILPHENCIFHPTVMMRRAEILGLGGYDARFPHAEDYELWLRASRRYKLANIPEPLLRYRLSHGGVSFSKRWEMLGSVFLAQETHREPPPSPQKAAKAAQARLAGANRPKFFYNVLRAAVDDLILLQQWDDALTLLEKSGAEISPAQLTELKNWILEEKATAGY